MNKQEVKSEKPEGKSLSSDEKRALEESVMIFHNKTTDEKITIDIEELEDSRLSVEIDFDPPLGEMKEQNVAANCASRVIEYLKS